MLHSLNIIERTLAAQDLFFDAHFAGNCSILLAGLNKLLLGVNPRSGKPDHMLNVAKIVTYNSWLPQQALRAVRIITYIVRQPNVSPLLLGEFTRTETLANEIRHGFVECLESDIIAADPMANDNDDDDDDNFDNDDDANVSGDDVELSIKEAIIGLLEECLPQSAPNLAHFLLGFDLTKDIRATRLQQPGVMDFPSNCTKSLITILDDSLDSMRGGRRTLVAPGTDRLIQSCYRFLYQLCSNSKTSEVVLRYDYWCVHLFSSVLNTFFIFVDS